MSNQTQQGDRSYQRIRFARFAWLSMCLSILTGLAHIRAFPSYNNVTSLTAIFASFESNVDNNFQIRKLMIFGILCGLTTLADFIFIIIWAGEIVQGNSGLVKMSLAAFVLNIIVKGILVYLAIVVWLAESSDDPEKHESVCKRGVETPPSKQRSPLENSLEPNHTPTSLSHKYALTPSIGIPGLVSPGFDPRDHV